MNQQIFKCILIASIATDVVISICLVGKQREPYKGPVVAISTVIQGLLILGILHYF